MVQRATRTGSRDAEAHVTLTSRHAATCAVKAGLGKDGSPV